MKAEGKNFVKATGCRVAGTNFGKGERAAKAYRTAKQPGTKL